MGHMHASCECGWSGEAVYRLIDLHESTAGSGDHSTVANGESASGFDEKSSVSLYDLDLRYYPY